MNAPYVRLGITLALGAVLMFFVLHATIGVPGSRELDLGMACLALMLAAPILSLGLPTMMLLNMSDLMETRGGEVDTLALARELGAACITTEPGGPVEKGGSWSKALALSHGSLSHQSMPTSLAVSSEAITSRSLMVSSSMSSRLT